MKTRNSSNGSTSQAPGSLFRRVKRSPCNPSLKGKQSSQKHNIQAVLSASQSPMSTRKKNHSQVENVKENRISLYESLSPIIKRRQALGQSRLADLVNVCRDPSSHGRRSEKEKNAPLKIINTCKENQAFPLEERMNTNTPQKGKPIKKDGKNQGVRKWNVVSDKENVLATDMTQIPVRKSKRIKVTTKRKDMLYTLKPVTKKTSNKEQNETNIVLEANIHNKKAVSSEADKRQPEPQLIPKNSIGTRILEICSSTAQPSSVTTRSGGEVVSDRTCNITHIATDQESSDEKENTRKNKDTTMPTRRLKRRPSHLDEDNIAKKANIGKADATPKLPVTSRRITRGVSSAKLNKSNRLSGKLPRKSQNKKLSRNSGSQKVNQAKSKPPVWASVKGIKVTPGKRKSFRINSDTYDFPSSPHEGQAEIKRRIVKKPRKKMKKKIKPTTKFTLLITDPSWQGTASKGMPFLSDSSVSTTKNIASVTYQNNSEFDADNEASVPSNVSSIRNEESAEEEFSTGFDFEMSNDVFLSFEEETRSSFVVPSKKRSDTNELVPMISASVLPTPAISKHISKFIGGSSTPRMENVVTGVNDNEETRTANDSIAECFGFDESEEECELNISPVQQSRLRSTLEVTGTSDVTVGELHPATLPSRFSWSSLRPGNQSRASASRSSSMVAQGRSVTFMTDVSRNSQTKITSFAAPTVNKQHLRLRREKRACQDKSQDTVSTEIEPGDKIEAAEVSVLFDEDKLMEKQFEDKEPNEASGVCNKPSQFSAEAPNKSPEKSFVKAPRRSYDRTSLLEAKRKFIEMHGGFIEPDGDGSSTENEKEEVEYRPKSRKKPTKMTKKKVTKSVKTAEGTSKKTAASKSKKKTKVYDASAEEWASRINSHFSEVDESLLMVE